MREKLRVEIKAEELISESQRLLFKIRYKCNACMHLERSVNSTHFNIGEGVVAFKPKVKAEKYDIARREAKEVQKALSALVLRKKLREEDVERANDLADAVIGMLTNMIKNLEQRM
jgi:four helix bundle protein